MAFSYSHNVAVFKRQGTPLVTVVADRAGENWLHLRFSVRPGKLDVDELILCGELVQQLMLFEKAVNRRHEDDDKGDSSDIVLGS